MYQWLISEMAVDKRNASPDPFQGKPEHQVFRAVSTIDCNHFSFSDSEVIHEPVADSLQVVEKLLVRPRSALEHEKYVVWQVPVGMFFDIVCSRSDKNFGGS